MPGIALAAIRIELGEKVSSLAAADTLALVVKSPFAVFMIDCSFDLDALKSR